MAKKRTKKDVVTKKTWTRWVDAAGNRVSKDTPGAIKQTVESEAWYGWIGGRLVKLKAKSETRAREECVTRRREHREDMEDGIDPSRRHRSTPLADHLDSWQASLTAGGAGKDYVARTVTCVRWILDKGKIVLPADLIPSRVLQALDGLKAARLTEVALDPEKKTYKRDEVAKLLGISPAGVTAAVARLGLVDLVQGNGKARAFPVEVVQALLKPRTRGRSSKTRQQYRAAIRQFSRWLVADRHLPSDPLAGMRESTGKGAKVKRVHHARRSFTVEEMQAILKAAQDSTRPLAGLTGQDRHALYLTAIYTGWRAQELASLRPDAFRLQDAVPTIFLDGAAAKNSQDDEQPIPQDVAQALALYLEGKPADQPVWGGVWWQKAAGMLRKDLRAAGVPYMVQTPQGDEFGDFHSLRHSFVALLDQAGATLKQAMQLARHSDPRLTMARYGRASKKDLAATVQRLPSLFQQDATENPLAVGLAVGTGGSQREEVSTSEIPEGENTHGAGTTQPLDLPGVESNREHLIVFESNSPTRIRTLNLAVNSRSLYR